MLASVQRVVNGPLSSLNRAEKEGLTALALVQK